MTGKLRKLIALVALVSVAADALGKEPGTPV